MDKSRSSADTSPKRLLVHCWAEKCDDQWVACTLELGLAVQADTLAEAKAKLLAQLRDYVREALIGEDRQHAEVLLHRRAPLSMQFRYYSLLVRQRIHLMRPRKQIFTEPMPLAPA